MNPKYFNPNVEEAIKVAEANGFEVIRSTPTTLLLDLDTKAQREQFDKTYPMFCQFYEPGEHGFQTWKSKNGNEHIVIHLAKALSVTHRIALETILGSDPSRSLFALGRVKNGVEEPGLLFKPNTKATIGRAKGEFVEEDAPF